MDKDSKKPLKELLDSVRDIDGFPISEDEDILALSDPPFYTACPNPYIEQFIEEYGTPYDAENDDYDKEPFVGKVSEGKGDSVYKAHPYHTKVPHRAIMEFIEHYTEPGDIVFDGFCGSGMTGVASQMLNRYSIIFDLAPIATFMSYNYTNLPKADKFKNEANAILNEIEREYGWIYETKHTNKSINVKTGEHPQILEFDNNIKGKINYLAWSDILICPYCDNEYVFFDQAFNYSTKQVYKKYNCPKCNAEISKRESQKAFDRKYDPVLKKEIKVFKEIPVLINYSVGNQKFEKNPDEFDLKLIEKINNIEIPYWFPVVELPDGPKSNEPKKSYEFVNIHQFYTTRSLLILGKIFNILVKNDSEIKNYLIYTFEQAVMGLAKICRYVPTHFSQVNQYLSGTLYIGSMRVETSINYVLENKIKRLAKMLETTKQNSAFKVIVSTQSTTELSNIPDNSVDYIFTDPPFGSNLMYSELSFLWESWLKIFTNNQKEAIINKSQNKGINEYTSLMTASFMEMKRILKPKRWITIVFHNTQASIWNSIQESITRAGFIISQVSVLDKKQGSFNQVSASGAVKNDLIINAFKPEEEFSKRLISNAGEGMEIDFVKEQLKHLPIRPNIGRTEKMLYSKTLAHYVENGFKIRYNSNNFYTLLNDNFTELDGNWFLDNQVIEYNRWKSGLSLDKLKEMLNGQQILIVNDEKSTLTWIYNYLNEPKDFSTILTAYRQVATKIDDIMPELREILETNFIMENSKFRRPIDQIEREELSKNRTKELDREFYKLLEQAKTQKGKIREVRREAIIYGFTKCYQEGKYQDILTIADKLYANTLESSGDIMDFIDIARIKTEGSEDL